MYSTCNYSRYSNRLLLCGCIYCLAERFCCVPPAPCGHNTAAVGPLLSSNYSSHIYMGFMPEHWLHHNICVLCPVKWNVMHPFKVEMSCNDISFNFNYIIVTYGTSSKPASKQFSHQTRQHEKAPEFHQMLMECCIYEIKMFLVPVWNEMCIGVIESIRIVSCVGINWCL